MSYMGQVDVGKCGSSCSTNYSPRARDLAEPSNMLAYSQGRNLVTGEKGHESVGSVRASHADYSLGSGKIAHYAGSDMGPAKTYRHDIPTIRILM